MLVDWYSIGWLVEGLVGDELEPPCHFFATLLFLTVVGGAVSCGCCTINVPGACFIENELTKGKVIFVVYQEETKNMRKNGNFFSVEGGAAWIIDFVSRPSAVKPGLL